MHQYAFFSAYYNATATPRQEPMPLRSAAFSPAALHPWMHTPDRGSRFLRSFSYREKESRQKAAIMHKE